MQFTKNFQWFLFFLPFCLFGQQPSVQTGLDLLFTEHESLLKNRTIGVVTNHTAIDSSYQSAIELFQQKQKACGFTLKAFFAPEHGLFGDNAANAPIASSKIKTIPVYSLYGETRRPKKEFLHGIDCLIFDIQDIGSRSYTYKSTLFYVMEEAAHAHIPVIVLDRPNPLGGTIVDGPMLEEEWRSFIGYVNVPYIYGMTIGELAMFFNAEYHIGCDLTVVWMKGWKRGMSFADTELPWIPASPYIPEETTPYFYPITGPIGECGSQILSIGIGYTLPFKMLVAPWINAEQFAQALRQKKMPGIEYIPMHARPFDGPLKGQACQGVLFVITDSSVVRPVSTCFAILVTLKKLYPEQFALLMQMDKNHHDLFCKAFGTEKILHELQKPQCSLRDLYVIHEKERKQFLLLREKYLHKEYMLN